MEINKLSLEEKVAQLFMVGVNEKDIDGVIDLIQNYKIGGVVIYRRNYDNYKEMVEVVNKIKKANQKNNIPIFISTDQEGGRVNRMPDDVMKLESAMKTAKTADIEIVKQSGKIIGEMLNKTGISINYGPVLDIKRFQENHAIGDRCYGETIDEVEKICNTCYARNKKTKCYSSNKTFSGSWINTKRFTFSNSKNI